MTESTKIDYVSIVQDLRDEADLCRNETATDIADLLDDAASCIVAMKSQFTALRSELAAALERINKSEADIAAMTTYAKTQQDRALAAEARAEDNHDRGYLLGLRAALGMSQDAIAAAIESRQKQIDAAIAEGK